MFNHFRSIYLSLYNSEYFRIFIGYIRWFYFVKISKKLKTFEGGDPKDNLENTISHNMIVYDKFPLVDFRVKRMTNLINSIGGIETLKNESVFLIIGPRTESDILKIKGLFYTNRIFAIDLISYSPWIDLQNMHELNFESNFFDCTICGWTISYSNNPILLIKNLIRVTKNAGFIAFGVEHVTIDKLVGENYISDDRQVKVSLESLNKRINSISDFFDLINNLDIKFKVVFQFGEESTQTKKSSFDQNFIDNVMLVIQIFK